MPVDIINFYTDNYINLNAFNFERKMEKFMDHLIRAEKRIQTAAHMAYVTFPLVRDKKILIKILIETKIAVAECINSILQYEYLFKRISLYKDKKANFRTFENKCSKRYGITKEEFAKITLLFDIIKKHKESPFEFIKNERVVILSEDLIPETITLEMAKEFLELAKNLLKKQSKAYQNTLKTQFCKYAKFR